MGTEGGKAGRKEKNFYLCKGPQRRQPSPLPLSNSAQLILNLKAGEGDLESLLWPQRGWGDAGMGVEESSLYQELGDFVPFPG